MSGSAYPVIPIMSRHLLLAAAFALAVVPPSAAQGRRFGFQQFGSAEEFYTPPEFRGNHPYDGRFTFARIKYRGYDHFAREGPGWSHDYPRADFHLMKIMREITALRPFIEEGNIRGGNIIALDDPMLLKYPVAYLSEPGGWHPNDQEVKGLREYLLKGGFILFDDFGYTDIQNADYILKRAIPNAKILPLPDDHPIWDSFFKVEPSKIPWQNYRNSAYRWQPAFFALFQDNDPKKRVLCVFADQLDIGESWEFSDEGFVPVSESNEAYKLGVNILIYALTH